MATLGWSLKPSRSKRPCRLKWVSQLIDANTREWDMQVLNRYFYEHDIDEILKIKIPRRADTDFVGWHYEKTGYFSVRSAYKLGVDLRDLETGMQSSEFRVLLMAQDQDGRSCGCCQSHRRSRCLHGR